MYRRRADILCSRTSSIKPLLAPLASSCQLGRSRDQKNGYVAAREYIDEAESGRIADRRQLRRMLEEASRPNAPFDEMLVWKEISSSNFPRFDRNTNTGGLIAKERETRPALQMVFHDVRRPSHVVLPTVPA